MATVSQAGLLSNRELQVDNAYNDPQNGYITVLQKQIDEASKNTADANSILKSAFAALTTLKNGLITIRNAGINTGDIPPIKNWYLGTRSLLGKNITTAIPEVQNIVAPNPLTQEGADSWVNYAQGVLDNINNNLKNTFLNSVDVGYIDDSGKLIPTNNAAGRSQMYSETLGKTAALLQNAIDSVKNKLKNYTNSLINTQASIDSQMTIIDDAQKAYDASVSKLENLNTQMSKLRLAYQTDMANAADVTAASAQQALQLQLANDPVYQKAVLDSQMAKLAAETQLQTEQIESASQERQARIQADADIEKAKVQALADAQKSQISATETTAAKDAEAKKMNTMLWVGATVLVVVVLSIAAYYIWGKD